jgi:predicted signal transduction protein with EAL and GGDEF domain
MIWLLVFLLIFAINVVAGRAHSRYLDRLEARSDLIQLFLNGSPDCVDQIMPAGRIAARLNVEQLFEITKAGGTIFKDLDQHVIELQGAIERRAPMNRISELADGQTIVVTYCPIQNGDWVATDDDVTERKQNEDRISNLALHDPANGLPNRAALYQRLARTLGHASIGGKSFAVVCVDTDRLQLEESPA